MPTLAELTIRIVGDDKSAQASIARTKQGLAETTAAALTTAEALAKVDAMFLSAAKAAGVSTTALELHIAGAEGAAKASASLNRTLSSPAMAGYAGRVETTSKAVTGRGRDVDLTRAKAAALNAELGRLRNPAVSGAGVPSGRSGGSGGADPIGKFAGAASGIGRTLTFDVTLPPLAIDAASLKVYTDFDAAMGKVRALGGVSKEQADAWSASILKMGPAIGKSPTELGNAMLYVASEGYRGAEALDVLNRAGKMSAVGMGTTATSARAVVFAMRDFPAQHLTAAQASDALVAATRVGNFEIDKLTASLGRVLPIAANLGVSFPQTVAAIAGITKAGAPASQGITDLARIMLTFEHPTRQTSTALKALGLDANTVAAHMRGDLLGALVEIENKSRGNEAQFTKVFGSAKAFGGVLSLLGGNLQEARAGFDSVVRSSGALGSAFGAGANQASRSLAQMEADGVAIGGALVPALQAAERDAMGLGRAFTELSPGTQRTIIDFGLLAAASGPLVSGVGKVALTMKALADLRAPVAAATEEAAALTSLAGAEGTAAVAAGALDIALLPIVATVGGIMLGVYGLGKALEYLTGGERRERQATIDGLVSRAQMTAGIARESAAAALHSGHLANLYRRYEVLRDTTHRTAAQSEEFRQIMALIGEQNPTLVAAFDNQGRTVGLLAGQYANLAAEADRAGAAARRAANESRIAAVQAVHQVPLSDAIAKGDQARYVEQIAKTRLARLRAHGLDRVVSGKPDANGDFDPHTEFDKSSRAYQEELARSSRSAFAATKIRASLYAAQLDAQNKERAAFEDSKLTPAQRAAKAAKDYTPTPNEPVHQMLGGGGGDSGGGRKGSKGPSEADQIRQSLLDSLQRLGTAYILLGNDSDTAAAKQEILHGQWAKSGAQLSQLNLLVSQMTKSGDLDKAAQSLGFKQFAGLTGDTRLKVELLALTSVTEARKRDMKVADDAAKAEAKYTEEAVKKIQDARHAANEARLDFLRAANPGAKDQASLKQFEVLFRDLKDPKAIAAIVDAAKFNTATDSLKAQAEAWKRIGDAALEAGKKQREAVASATDGRAKLFAELRDQGGRLRANTPEDSDAARFRAILDQHRDAILGPGQSSLGAVGSVAYVASLAAQNSALERARTYAGNYDGAMRGLRREYIGLTDASDKARVAAREFSESGVRLMSHEMAVLIVQAERANETVRRFHEESRHYGEMTSQAFTDGFTDALDHGLRSGFRRFLASVDRMIETEIVGGAAKGIGAWVTRSMNRSGPGGRPATAGGDAQGGAFGGVAAAAKAALGIGGKDAALNANTKALVALTMKLAMGSLPGGAGGFMGGLTGVAAQWASLLATGAGKSKVGDALGQGIAALHFTKGGHVRAGQVGFKDEQGGEPFIADVPGTIYPRDSFQHLSGNILPADLMRRARDASGGSSSSGGGGEVHNHTHNVTVAPLIHVSGPVDRRSELTIRGAVADGVRQGMDGR